MVAVVLVVAAAPASAQDTGPDAAAPASEAASADRSLEVALDQKLEAPETPAVGDPLELVLSIEHPSDATARLQNPVLEGSRWHLLETRRSEAKNEDRTTTRITAVFQIFRPGEATLGPQVVRVSTDEVERTVETNPETIDIAATLDSPGDASFQGPRPPRPVWQRDWTTAWVGGGLLAAAAIALGVLGVMRRREDEADATPDRPPEELARERLEELAATDLLEHGDFMVYYVRLSEIVRRYFGRRYGFPGTELTTAEILDRLAATPAVDEATHRDIGEWLRAADLVKFSGLIPPVEEAEEHLDRAFELIEATAPVAKPETDEIEKDGEEATPEDEKEPTPGRRRDDATARTPQHQSEATPEDDLADADSRTDDSDDDGETGGESVGAEHDESDEEDASAGDSLDADDSVDRPDEKQTTDSEPADTDEDDQHTDAPSADPSGDGESDESDGGDSSTDVPAEHAPYAPPGARPDDSTDEDDDPRRDGDD
jgi:hypothetical protein